ncbi:MAG TPA: Uma2 family endonuclease [Bryobacteraceae bacterium]
MAVLTDAEIAEMLPATFTKPGLTEEEYFALCAKFDDFFVEYTADGTVIFMPGTDPETSEAVLEVSFQLVAWARGQGRGRVTGPDASFLFPNGARREPDAAWFDAERWKAAKAREPGRRVPMFAPEFVIEVRSPEQRARTQREKMEEYIANGVLLGWLIDPLDRTVTIYRPGREPEILTNPTQVAGEGPVAGFVPDLSRIF